MHRIGDCLAPGGVGAAVASAEGAVRAWSDGRGRGRGRSAGGAAGGGVGDLSLAGARSPELGDRPTLVVPLGSVEQHGPHLPLGTDTTVAAAVAAGLLERLPGAAAGARAGLRRQR